VPTAATPRDNISVRRRSSGSVSPPPTKMTTFVDFRRPDGKNPAVHPMNPSLAATSSSLPTGKAGRVRRRFRCEHPWLGWFSAVKNGQELNSTI